VSLIFDVRQKNMSADENLILYFIPSLVATLWNHEKRKGGPLTEDEVIAIRDKAPVIALRPEMVRQMDEKRGYEDIDAENCWDSWLVAREGLVRYESEKETRA
jgi:hypothetical protein